MTSQPWSLRDIIKIFLRIKNQKIYHENYINIGTAINLLFYALSSTTKGQLNKVILDNLITALVEVFQNRVKKDDLKKYFMKKLNIMMN